MTLSAALDDCLHRLQAGETVAACLARYPDQADELSLLLAAAGRIRPLAGQQLSEVQRAAGRAAVAAAALEQSTARQAPLRQSRSILAWLGGGRAFGRAMAALAVVLFLALAATTVLASQPGDIGYPLRVMAERAPVVLRASRAAQADAELRLADRRLTDLEGFVRSQRRIEATALAALLRSDEAAAQRAIDLPQTERDLIAERIEQHADAIYRLAARDQAADIADRLREVAQRMEQAAARLRRGRPAPSPSPQVAAPSASPTATQPAASTPAPTPTSSPTQPLEIIAPDPNREAAAATPQPPEPTSTPSAEPSETPTHSKPTSTPTATGQPGQTASPSATTTVGSTPSQTPDGGVTATIAPRPTRTRPPITPRPTRTRPPITPRPTRTLRPTRTRPPITPPPTRTLRPPRTPPPTRTLRPPRTPPPTATIEPTWTLEPSATPTPSQAGATPTATPPGTETTLPLTPTPTASPPQGSPTADATASPEAGTVEPTAATTTLPPPRPTRPRRG